MWMHTEEHLIVEWIIHESFSTKLLTNLFLSALTHHIFRVNPTTLPFEQVQAAHVRESALQQVLSIAW